MPNVVSLLPTPNPNAYKFVLDTPLLRSGSRNYNSLEACGEDPIGKTLFEVKGVTNVFYLNDFLTVSAKKDADWAKIAEAVKEVLKNYEAPSDPVPQQKTEAKKPVESGPFDELTEEEKLARIEAVLDEDVRPALAGDGGGILVRGIRGHEVGIFYQGACGSCPSATAGTLMAIQRMLQDQLDPRLTVVTAPQ